MITYLRDILPFDLFKQMLDGGFIRSQVHPLYPELLIFNYTEAAQYDRVWNAATNVCRGLIVRLGDSGVIDGDAEVIARPFNKFHNLNTEYVPETLEANLPTDFPPLVTTKLDGSMGILYARNGERWIATRGSFDSEQARWATKWFRENYPDFDMEQEITFVFEVIYQSNRIVVDYDFEGMVLLGIIDNFTGQELPRDAVEYIADREKMKLVPKFTKSLAECAAENTPNEEGYVLTYSNGVKVKVKFAEYVRLHRVLTGLNPRTIWEMLSDPAGHSSVEAILNDPKMPVTFIDWFGGWVKQLREKYARLEAESLVVFAARPAEGSRKDLAMYFKQTPHLCSILFAMLDGKNSAGIIWDRLEPAGNATFKKDGE